MFLLFCEFFVIKNGANSCESNMEWFGLVGLWANVGRLTAVCIHGPSQVRKANVSRKPSYWECPSFLDLVHNFGVLSLSLVVDRQKKKCPWLIY